MPWLQSTNPSIDWVALSMTRGTQTVTGVSTHPTARVGVCSAKALLRQVRRHGVEAWCAVLTQSADASAVAMGATAAAQEPSETGQSPGQTRWSKLCDECEDIFASLSKLPPPDRVKHEIKLLDEAASPPKPRIYRMSPAELAEVRRQLDDYLAKGFI